MRWWERAWIAGIAALVAVTSLGLLGELWPFQGWTMFSSPGPRTSDFLVVVAVHDTGARQVHHDERLPGGYVRDLYQHRFERAPDSLREADCRRMLADLREDDPAVVAVELEHRAWVLLQREGRHPDNVDRQTVWRCGRT